MPPLAPPDPATLGDLTDQERDALDAMTRSGAQDSGYSTMHRTRPQTIGYALTDSPAGLAAWIIEKLMSWTDPRSELSPDAILDNLMLYWLPRTAASSARLYWESLQDVTRWLEGPLEPRDLVDTPAGCTRVPLRTPTSLEALGRAALPQHPSTGTNPTAAVTSRPWNSRRCSSTS